MKKIAFIMMILLLSVSLNGCKNNDLADEETETKTETETVGTETETKTETTDTEIDNDTQENVSEAAELTDEMREAYYNVLTNVCEQYIWPDGSEVDTTLGTPESEGNYFAVADVDGDGQQELLISYKNATMAGMELWVCGYESESDEVYTELVEFPNVVFYDNGIATAGWSHNMGIGPSELWPYNLYQYNAASNSYEFLYSVEGWDKSISETNEEGDAFPEKIDADGNGIIYFKNPYGVSNYDDCMDDSEYEAWIQSYIGDANEIEIDWKEMTNYRSIKDDGETTDADSEF